MRAAHRTEVGKLVRVLGQGFVVEFPGLFRVQAEVELVLPAELETRLAQRVVTHLCPRMALGQVGRVRGDLVGHDPRSEEHTSELQSLMRISYAVFCLKKKKKKHRTDLTAIQT